MNKNNVNSLEIIIKAHISTLSEEEKFIGITEEKIDEISEALSILVNNLTEEEKQEAIKNIKSNMNITMDTGIVIRDEDTYKKWYFGERATRSLGYWDRYREYLMNNIKMPIKVVDSIDSSTDEIMDCLGDPKANYDFDRKGLVIGDVQSGKTSNYIALMNKAADSGYKTIILLTGTIEKLRQQTQIRVDEGFSGKNSKAQMLQKKDVSTGVGCIKQLPVTTLTTTEKDFNLSESISIKDQNGPVVFVLKKNKSVLEKFQNWLKLHNRDRYTDKIEEPLLLIDDEADNASINTSKEEDSPTVINNKIREIINIFSKSSYIGFTATPFANIFIDPQLESDNGDDLFPRDFIYLLNQPSNYIGPNSMYEENGKYNYMLRNNDDVEEVLPLKHKGEDYPEKLPQTLKDSIIVFFLSNAIRDLRGDQYKDRSMLIHISRFIKIQNSTKELVDEYVRFLKNQIKLYVLSKDEHEVISNIKRIFYQEFKQNDNELNISEDWEDIKEILFKSVDPIQVRVVNSGTASKGLNYDEYEKGLRIIVIGGLSLSRGLTLEGLMTSYFYRNTKMYDTLMQMGRWFGYRDGYDDICRLWISEESAEWYSNIAIATDELKSEIKMMSNENKKPIEFGLKVRSFDETPLIITARNKMRTADIISIPRSLNGKVVETAVIDASIDKNNFNNSIITKWLCENYSEYRVDKKLLELDRDTLKDVPKDKVIELLEKLEFPYLNDISQLKDEIKRSDSSMLEKWDVFIATKKLKDTFESIEYGPLEINPVERTANLIVDNKFLRISGSKARLGTTNFAKAGLMKEEFKKIEEKVNDQRRIRGFNKNGKLKNASENMYFSTGIVRNPLLIIYPIRLKESNEIDKRFLGENNLFTGVSIGIPEIEGRKNIVYEYAINVVEQREKMGFSIDDEESDEE